ncbi:MAG: hypothetical protein V4568_11745 [Pseudomonadota bacterium]
MWLVLACLLPGVIGAGLLFAYEYQEDHSQLANNTLQTTRALVQAVDSHLLSAKAIAQVLSTADSLAKQDLARFHEHARKAAALMAVGVNVVLMDEAGRQTLNTLVQFGQPLPTQAAPELVHGVFSAGKLTVSDIFIGPVLKRPTISVDVPVILDGKITYALAVHMLPEHFNAILKAQNLPPSWVATVFDSTGTIIGRTHSAETFVGQKIGAELLKSMRTSPEGSIDATTVDGIPVLLFYSRSPATKLGAAVLKSQK